MCVWGGGGGVGGGWVRGGHLQAPHPGRKTT